MATFQFYQKEQIALHLDVDSPSFLTEKYQLVEQGFERIGDVVRAENAQLAHEKFKTIYLDELKNFADTHLFVGTAGVLGGL